MVKRAGWKVHPQNHFYWYRGQEVLTEAQLREKYRLDEWQAHPKDGRFYKNAVTSEILTERQLGRRYG